jgi:WD40 repeat protein
MLISSQTPEGRLDPYPVVSSRSSGRISSALIAALIGIVGATAHAQVFSPDGSRLAAVEDSGVLNLYDATSGRVRWTVADPQRPGACSVAFSGDGSRIAAGGWDRWEVDEPGGGRPDAGGHYGGRGFIGAKGGKVRVWEAADGREVRTIAGLPLGVLAVHFLGPDAKQLVTVDTDFRVTVHALDTGRVAFAMNELAAQGRGHVGPGISPAFGADGRRLVLPADASVAALRLNVWDLEGRRARRLDLPGPASGPVALSPDGTRLFVGERHLIAGAAPCGRDRAERWLRERDLATGEIVAGPASMRIQLVLWGLLAISPDGTLIVTVGQETTPGEAGTLMVWDSRAGRRLREIRDTHGQPRAVAFLPGRVRVASNSTERDPATGFLKTSPLKIWEFELSR